ncbi:MAG: hypothetical protein AAGA92_09150 [Planctomycetota bacterium]
MTTWTPEDQRALDALIDDELPQQQRDALLHRLEEHPGGWRRCALAFLEDQAVGGGVRAMLTGDRSARLAEPATRHRSGRTSGLWLAAAASLLAAFAAGRLAAPSSEPGPSLAAARGGAVAPAAADEALAANARAENSPDTAEHPADGDIVTLLVRDAEGVDQRVRVPLVDAGSEPVPWQESRGLTGLRGRLIDEGFELRRRRRIAPLFFEEEDRLVPMAVPVEDTFIVPVSRPVY